MRDPASRFWDRSDSHMRSGDFSKVALELLDPRGRGLSRLILDPTTCRGFAKPETVTQVARPRSQTSFPLQQSFSIVKGAPAAWATVDTVQWRP